MHALIKFSVAGCLAGFTAVASLPAAAHGYGSYGVHYRGPRVGIHIGMPLYPTHYYPAPYYVYPRTVYVQPATTTVYVERNDTQAASAPQSGPAGSAQESYWYYCPDSKAYYPHVGSCASPWQRVTPQPPPSTR